jgi:DNA-binding transcriptional LysR family regulator
MSTPKLISRSTFNISLKDLQIFALVAYHRSFKRAAIDLCVSPSALSHTLKGLEQSLGLRLLSRTSRSVAPTAVGQQLLDQLAPSLQQIRLALESINVFRDSPVGTLRLNAPRAAAELVLPEVIAQFLMKNPDMKVDVAVDNAFVDIVGQGFDAGVRYMANVDEDMVCIPLGPAHRFVVVASPQYLARYKEPTHPKDLAKHRCIVLQFASGKYHDWSFIDQGQLLTIQAPTTLISGDMRFILASALAGVGLACVYQSLAAPSIAAGQLRMLLEPWAPPVQTFALYYPSRLGMTAGLRSFIEEVKLWQSQIHMAIGIQNSG